LILGSYVEFSERSACACEPVVKARRRVISTFMEACELQCAQVGFKQKG